VLNFLRYGNLFADAGIDLKGILEEGTTPRVPA
jgi:hypothetical protein